MGEVRLLGEMKEKDGEWLQRRGLPAETNGA
jgi:hypothetical protein